MQCWGNRDCGESLLSEPLCASPPWERRTGPGREQMQMGELWWRGGCLGFSDYVVTAPRPGNSASPYPQLASSFPPFLPVLCFSSILSSNQPSLHIRIWPLGWHRMVCWKSGSHVAGAQLLTEEDVERWYDGPRSHRDRETIIFIYGGVFYVCWQRGRR